MDKVRPQVEWPSLGYVANQPWYQALLASDEPAGLGTTILNYLLDLVSKTLRGK